MKRNCFNKLLVFIVFVFFLSCSTDEPDDETNNTPTIPAIFPRGSIVSQNTNIANVNVEIEGLDGNLVSGAVVLVSNSVNGVNKCAYDPATCSYNGKYPIPADGIINIIIKSILSPVPLTYSIFAKYNG